MPGAHPLVAAAVIVACPISGCVHTTLPPSVGEAPALTPGDHRVDVNDVTLAYHVFGTGPLCFVNPGGPGFDWVYMRMPDVESHLTMIYVEPVGTGASGQLDDSGAYTKQRYVDDLEGLRAALGVERAFVLGHSFGGFVAQLYAIQHPARVQGLILYDTGARTDSDTLGAVEGHLAWFHDEPWGADAVAGFASVETVNTDEGADAMWRRVLPMYFGEFDRSPERFRAAFSGMHVHAAPLDASRHDSAAFDTRVALGRLALPALVVVGRRDFVTSVPLAEELHAALRGSTLTILEHSGHMGHIEEPAAFSATIVRFVESVVNK